MNPPIKSGCNIISCRGSSRDTTQYVECSHLMEKRRKDERKHQLITGAFLRPHINYQSPPPAHIMLVNTSHKESLPPDRSPTSKPEWVSISQHNRKPSALVAYRRIITSSPSKDPPSARPRRPPPTAGSPARRTAPPGAQSFAA